MTMLLVLFACGGSEPASPLDTSELERAPEETTVDASPAAESPADSPAPTEVEGAFAYARDSSGRGTRDILALNPDTGEIGTLTTLNDATDQPTRIWAAGDELWMANRAELFRLDTTGSLLGVTELELVDVFASDEAAVWVQSSASTEPYFSKLDPETLEVISSVEPDEFDRIHQIAVGGGSLWITWDFAAMEIDRRDPDTLSTIGTVVATTGTRETEFRVEALAWGEDSLWAAGPLAHEIGGPIALARISADGTVQSQIVLADFEGVGEGNFESSGAGIAVGLGAVWVVDERGSQVARVDPATNTEVARIQVVSETDNPTSGLHIASGRVWWRVLNTLYAIDPATNEATPVVELPTTGSLGVINVVGPIVFPVEEN